MEKCLPKSLHIREVSDRREWEQFWNREGPQALFQSWLWGMVIKRRMVPLFRFGMYEGSDLVGIFQVVAVRGRRGTYLHVRHGPVLIRQKRHYWRAALTTLASLARKEGAWFLRVSPHIDDSSIHRELFRSFGLMPSVVHEVDGERCLLLSLDRTEDEILAGMRKTTRYEIRHAQKQGVRVVSSTDLVDLDKFLDLYRETSKRQHFVEHKGIREEFELYTNENDAVLLFGYHERTFLSAAIILFSGNQAIYHHGASIPTKLPVNYAVQWEAIRMAKKRGLSWYNFWGVAPVGNHTHPWYGHSLFKRGFGGSEVVTIHAHDFPTSGLYSLTRAIEWLEERRRGY